MPAGGKNRGLSPKMKIILMNPLWTKPGIVPTNIAELAGYVRAAGFSDISLLDLNYELGSEIAVDNLVNRAVEKVAEMNPDLLGISCNTIHVPFVAEFCRAFKKNFDTPIVLGGIHPTFRPHQMFKLTDADFIVRGEGEVTFLELLKALEEGRPLNRIAGLSYRKKRAHHNASGTLMKDLSSLPFPAYDMLIPYGAGRNRVYLSGSRGCPFGCQFCSAHRMWMGQRRKPIQRIMDEIAFFKRHFDFGFIRFNDDCITLDRQWLYELLGHLHAMEVQWDCYSRVDTIDEQLMKDMRKAGCLLIYHGIESGSQRLRDMLGKKLSSRIDNEYIVKVVEKEIEHGLLVYCSFMTGIPTETEEEMRSTIRLGMALKSLGATVQFWIMTPYPDIEAVYRYRESLIKLNRWQRLQQADVFATDQYHFYRDYYEKYKKENPDFLMFHPAMDLRRFFAIYREGREKLCD
jgi:anaerobic magnesium-protoporphyrin IX monomethyl ester cyclase